MSKPIKARYPGKCKTCKKPFAQGATVFWSKASGTLCEACGSEQGSGNGQSQETAQSGSQSAAEPVKPVNVPGTTEHGKDTYFTIDFAELRDIVKSALKTGTVPLKMRKGNVDKIVHHTQGVGTRFHGYTAGQLGRWIDEGFQSGAIQGLADFTPPIREKRHYVYLEEGEEIHIDRALSGEDNAYGDWTKRETIPGVAIEAECMFSAGTKPETVNAYNTWICRAIYALESAGIDCEVTMKFSSDNATGEGKNNHSIVRVKRENEQTDFQSFSPILSPAALRTFGFTAIVLHAEKRGKQVASGLGHGRKATLWSVKWDAERRVLTFDCPYMPSSFPEGKMDTEFRQALREMKSN